MIISLNDERLLKQILPGSLPLHQLSMDDLQFSKLNLENAKRDCGKPEYSGSLREPKISTALRLLENEIKRRA